jgi:hypothetical protein
MPGSDLARGNCDLQPLQREPNAFFNASGLKGSGAGCQQGVCLADDRPATHLIRRTSREARPRSGDQERQRKETLAKRTAHFSLAWKSPSEPAALPALCLSFAYGRGYGMTNPL